MYEESENKINWGNIIKKILIVIAVIIVIFGIITLVNRCTKKDSEDKGTKTEISLTESLDNLEAATLKYFNKDNLPLEINASKTVRLRILQNGDYVGEIKDSEGNVCNSNESYAEVTRLEDNYAVKLSIVCGSNTDYRVIYVGCFDNCESGICKGDQDSIGGSCTVEEKPAEDDKNDSSNAVTNTTNTTNSNTSSNTTKPSTGNNSSNSSNSTTNNKPKVTEYEYQKCTTNITYTDKTETNRLVAAASVSRATVTSYKPLRNSGNIKYISIGYSKEFGYEYEKITYSCDDPNYTFDSSKNECVYDEVRTVRVPVETPGTCETTWSAALTLNGWTRTGKTR